MKNNRLERLKAFLEETPNDPFLQYALALEYLKVEEDGKALLQFEVLVQDHPAYVGTYYHLGKLYEKLERYDDALDTFEAGIDTARQLGDAHSANELLGAFNMLNDELED